MSRVGLHCNKKLKVKTKTASTRMEAIVDLYDLHKLYFKNVLEGLRDTDAHNRLGTKANHIAWLAGSLVQQRFELANMLGIKGAQKAVELFKDNKGIQEHITYPRLEEYKEDWNNISPQLKEALQTVTDEKLDASFEMMPGMQMTHYELITFIIYREANCIGQIALWRRLLGYEPMKYM
jgi:hypothetical protein